MFIFLLFLKMVRFHIVEFCRKSNVDISPVSQSRHRTTANSTTVGILTARNILDEMAKYLVSPPTFVRFATRVIISVVKNTAILNDHNLQAVALPLHKKYNILKAWWHRYARAALNYLSKPGRHGPAPCLIWINYSVCGITIILPISRHKPSPGHLLVIFNEIQAKKPG